VATWLALAIIGQFLYAVSVLIDRHIVVRAQHIGKPLAYTFYVSLMSCFVFVLLPFGLVSWPEPEMLSLSLINAGAFVSAIFFLYSSLRLARASDVSPVVGAVSAITALVFAGLLIPGDVTKSFFLPVLFLAAGTALISHFHFSRRAVVYTLLSGLFFGITAFTFKLVVLESNFIDSFFWTRTMNVAIALAFLIVPSLRATIFRGGKHASHGAKLLVVGNKIIGGLAAAVTALAIALGSVSVVNALAGLQFVFLYFFALLFAERMPLGSGKKTGSHGGWQTGIGIVLIVSGLALLYLGHYSTI
jgi:uncharacterized membrane protein